MTRIGLIVNPVAGLGGRVGMHGTDGEDARQRAVALGAAPQAGRRAALALAELRARRLALRVLTVAGDMGEEVARSVGVPTTVVCERTEHSTAVDTRRAAAKLVEAGARLIMFAGGDGTARDVLDAIGVGQPVIGIPAGVKMHSAVYAITPRAAGEVADAYLSGRAAPTPSEVMDREHDSIVLYGLLSVPRLAERVQRGKIGSTRTGRDDIPGIAAEIAAAHVPGRVDVYGPGTTTQALLSAIGIDAPATGVTAARDGACLALDADAATLTGLAEGRPVRIIVSPIGGQGFLFGRGNQQITPELLASAGREAITIVSGESKLAALSGRPLLTDTGDDALDALLSGHHKVVTGHRRHVIYRIGPT